MLRSVNLSKEISLEQMISLIDQFATSTEFFYWLAKSDLNAQVISEKKHGDLYEVLTEYYIDELLVYTGSGRYMLDKISESFSMRIAAEKRSVFDFIPELSHTDKKILSHNLQYSHYLILSEILCRGKICGSSWEIFDIPNLITVYQKRKDLIPALSE